MTASAPGRSRPNGPNSTSRSRNPSPCVSTPTFSPGSRSRDKATRPGSTGPCAKSWTNQDKLAEGPSMVRSPRSDPKIATMTGAYQFVCAEASTDALLKRLNALGGWQWSLGDSHWYGDYA